MNFYRETIENEPSVIAVPPELQNRAIEIIILPLEEKSADNSATEVDKNGYPTRLF